MYFRLKNSWFKLIGPHWQRWLAFFDERFIVLSEIDVQIIDVGLCGDKSASISC